MVSLEHEHTNKWCLIKEEPYVNMKYLLHPKVENLYFNILKTTHIKVNSTNNKDRLAQEVV